MGQIQRGAEEADGSLVARVLEGDQHAYALLVDRYVTEFGRYATALCRDADLAADAMQESFIRAYDALRSLDDADRFGAWFFRILTNQCHNHRDRAGKVILNSFGAIYPVEVEGETIVDTGHIVAFGETLDFKITKAGKSWISSILGGEGLVCRFHGQGTVWCQSHNPSSFGQTLGPNLRPRQ